MDEQLQTPVDTQQVKTTATPAAGDISVVDKAETVLKKEVWHFVTIAGIAMGVLGFFIGRLTKK